MRISSERRNRQTGELVSIESVSHLSSRFASHARFVDAGPFALRSGRFVRIETTGSFRPTRNSLTIGTIHSRTLFGRFSGMKRKVPDARGFRVGLRSSAAVAGSDSHHRVNERVPAKSRDSTSDRCFGSRLRKFESSLWTRVRSLPPFSGMRPEL